MSSFDKTAHSIEQQIATLRDRGLLIADEARAHHYLANISYFRLSAYTRPFYQPRMQEHHFLPNTCFDDVLQLYIFDRELRLLLLDAIERLEVSLRAQMSNVLAEHHGPHGYLKAEIFDTRYNHDWLLAKLEQLGSARQVESFLAHYRKKYNAAPKQPPIWMAVELLTFKEVSTLFSQLRLSVDTQRFERHYGVKMPVLRSWFRSLSDLRNVCAHHGRVWNREFGSRPEIPKKQPTHWPSIPVTQKLSPCRSDLNSGGLRSASADRRRMVRIPEPLASARFRSCSTAPSNGLRGQEPGRPSWSSGLMEWPILRNSMRLL